MYTLYVHVHDILKSNGHEKSHKLNRFGLGFLPWVNGILYKIGRRKILNNSRKICNLFIDCTL